MSYAWFTPYTLIQLSAPIISNILMLTNDNTARATRHTHLTLYDDNKWENNHTNRPLAE